MGGALSKGPSRSHMLASRWPDWITCPLVSHSLRPEKWKSPGDHPACQHTLRRTAAGGRGPVPWFPRPCLPSSQLDSLLVVARTQQSDGTSLLRRVTRRPSLPSCLPCQGASGPVESRHGRRLVTLSPSQEAGQPVRELEAGCLRVKPEVPPLRPTPPHGPERGPG